jgi:hypothetical protein
LWRDFDAAQQRRLDEWDRDARLAWMTTRLQRAERHPALESLLADRDGAASKALAPQTPEQQRVLFSVLADAFGGTVVHVPREPATIEEDHG